MVMHFSGRIADSFDREFRCLYADSQIIDCFFNAEEEGMPYYPSYQAMMAPGMGMGLGPVMGLDLLSDRYRARVALLRWFLCLFSGSRVDGVSCWVQDAESLWGVGSCFCQQISFYFCTIKCQTVKIVQHSFWALNSDVHFTVTQNKKQQILKSEKLMHWTADLSTYWFLLLLRLIMCLVQSSVTDVSFE